MMLTAKTKVLGSETRVSAISSNTDAWTGMESNGGCRGETPSSNRLKMARPCIVRFCVI